MRPAPLPPDEESRLRPQAADRVGRPAASGPGLPTSRSVVEQHGGRSGVESAVGRDSTPVAKP